jgi:hypothetical protein
LARLLIALVLLSCLWSASREAHAVADYAACAAKHKFPLVVGPPTQYVLPHQLEPEQKRLLVACADELKHLPFSDWVTNVFREDIKAGKVKAPLDLRAEHQKKVETQLDSSWAKPQSALARFLWQAGAWMALVLVLIVAWKIGPLILVIAGCGTLVFALFGATVGAGKGMFDEMGGMYPMFGLLAAIVLFVAGGILGIVRAWMRKED